MSDKIEVTIKDDKKVTWFMDILKIAIIPFTIAIFTIYYSNQQKNSEINLKYIELAIDILKQPDSIKNQHLKEYAKNIIKKYSEVPLTKEVEEEIQKIDFFLKKYNLDIEKNIKGNWEVAANISTNNLDKIAPIPSKLIRWHIKHPKNVIIDEKQYKIFSEQKVNKVIHEFLEKEKLDHHKKYNILND